MLFSEIFRFHWIRCKEFAIIEIDLPKKMLRIRWLLPCNQDFESHCYSLSSGCRSWGVHIFQHCRGMLINIFDFLRMLYRASIYKAIIMAALPLGHSRSHLLARPFFPIKSQMASIGNTTSSRSWSGDELAKWQYIYIFALQKHIYFLAVPRIWRTLYLLSGQNGSAIS